MPFTLSHTAAVLPLLRARKLSATCLIVGTMAPDFEYFFRVDIYSVYGHTLWGLLYYNIPVTIALAFVFHLVARNNFIDNLPAFFQTRLHDLRHFDFAAAFKQRPLWFALSALIGACTHVFWDGFTHASGWFVQHLPGVYEGSFVPFMGVNYPLWYALQHISTVVGLSIGVLYVFFAMPPKGKAVKPNLLYWVLIGTFMVVTALLKWYAGIERTPSVTIVIAMISGFCIGLIVLGFVRFRNDIPPEASR